MLSEAEPKLWTRYVISFVNHETTVRELVFHLPPKKWHMFRFVSVYFHL